MSLIFPSISPCRDEEAPEDAAADSIELADVYDEDEDVPEKARK